MATVDAPTPPLPPPSHQTGSRTWEEQVTLYHTTMSEEDAYRNLLLLCRNLLQTIRALHEAGYVHCDLKPQNIVTVDGMVRLIDLDSTRPEGDPFPHDRRGGTMFCSARYAAPEILKGTAGERWGVF